jgi:acetylornithine/N-succinyldiaminopimelate aminotransferase
VTAVGTAGVSTALSTSGDDAEPLTAVGSSRQSGSQWTERYRDAVMDTFGDPRRVLVRGEGAYVWDADGDRYLDLLAGIAVNSLGHAHPLLVAAVTGQLTTLGHISNFYASPAQIALAERLAGLFGEPGETKVFFTNSGAEANEAAFKLGRRTGRPRTVAAAGSFHGRTLGALALTSKKAYREPFEPLPGPVDFVPFNDIDALDAAVTDETAAVVLEPIQGENGVIPATTAYLRAARAITAERGALLVLDEVQSGMGRTGDWLAHTVAGITPDVVTLAKGLGGGIPIGACVATGVAATLFARGQHGTTFGGNPVAAAAGLAVFGAIERDGLLDNARTVGELLRDEIAQAHPAVAEVRGRGLLLAFDLAEPVAAGVARAALAAGFIVNDVRPDAIRLAPPLILSVEQALDFTTALPAIIDAALTAAHTDSAGAGA